MLRLWRAHRPVRTLDLTVAPRPPPRGINEARRSETTMDNYWARPSQDARGAETGSGSLFGDTLERPADDPLGDEAAFPSTWQHLAPCDAPRD